MIRHLFLALLTVATLATTGCHLFSKKSKPKENSAITDDVEQDLHRRWMEKRSAELVAAGATASAAQAQAETEFRARYGFTHAAQK